jgi:hypothetical protein
VARKLLIWAVLLLTPFTGVRVVCLDSPADVAEADSRLSPSQDCDEVCARPQKPRPKRGGFTCALKADTCSQLLTATVAVVPTDGSPGLQLVPTVFESPVGPQYVAPVLPLDSPPPKV